MKNRSVNRLSQIHTAAVQISAALSEKSYYKTLPYIKFIAVVSCCAGLFFTQGLSFEQLIHYLFRIYRK